MPFNTVEGRNLAFIVTKSHYSGDELHDTAISQAALDTARKLHSSFVRPYTRGQSEKKKKRKKKKI